MGGGGGLTGTVWEYTLLAPGPGARTRRARGGDRLRPEDGRRGGEGARYLSGSSLRDLCLPEMPGRSAGVADRFLVTERS